MIATLLLALGGLIVVFVIIVRLQPDDFHVVRSTPISAPSAEVFARTNDLHQYQLWNPWRKLDPAAQYTHEGPPAGTGASMTWTGNARIGAGRMTITESLPGDLVATRLDFLKPFAYTATAYFTFKPVGTQTVVTWSFSSKKIFISKAMGLFMNMDKMIGDQFENGLADLKAMSEGTGKS